MPCPHGGGAFFCPVNLCSTSVAGQGIGKQGQVGEVEQEVEQDGDTEAPAQLERQAIAGPRQRGEQHQQRATGKMGCAEQQAGDQETCPGRASACHPLLDASPEQRFFRHTGEQQVVEREQPPPVGQSRFGFEGAQLPGGDEQGRERQDEQG